MSNTVLKARGATAAAVMAAALAVSMPSGAADLCTANGVAFAFFNGVQNTQAQAQATLNELADIHGEVSANGDTITYEVLYNYTEGLDDFVEVFDQRLREQEGLLQDRFELFFTTLTGDGPWWERIIDAVPAAQSVLDAAFQAAQAGALQSLTSLYSNPPTAVNYAEHRLRIDNFALEGRKMLFVAHSQGNLFVNPAYDYALTLVGPESVKVVHIAPASPRTSGPHTLADLDLVINGLRAVGSVPPVTDTIPGFLLRSPGRNGNRDPLGHGMSEIYINQTLDISQSVRAHIADAIVTLVSPAATGSPGFFTATLTWDGFGDVDLHTFEPDGTQVYYQRRTGNSGYLDVDNVVSSGPEHYYATCDSELLQLGTYRVSVANYSRAEGRVATVQIASASEGALGTRSVTLGPPTGSTPAYEMFTVSVTQDPETGAVRATVN